jgi:uncharacterized protein (TIGR04552 family)
MLVESMSNRVVVEGSGPVGAFTPPQPRLTVEQAHDLAALKLTLTGESVIDASRLPFDTREQVDHFLRLNQFDTDNPLDLARLREVHQEALEYLTTLHHLRFPAELEEPEAIHDIFLAATHGTSRVRRFACMLLKVMHIVHHLGGRELTFALAVSEAQLYDRLSARVFTVIDRMRTTGIDVAEFSGGKKARASLVTKLLARRSTLTSHVFDKLRFSVTLRSPEDLVRALVYFGRNLWPFNFVVPEQSRNNIVTSAHIGRALALDPQVVRDFWDNAAVGAKPAVLPPPNEFSGSSYRSVSFVVDIPMRVDDLAPSASPAIAFVETEIQLIDEKTAVANSQGENSHSAYKKRQVARVRARLLGATDSDDVVN